MSIEDLSKSQLLLLTVLVNFIVSIATGVLTVSMLDQTPTTVTQTVNKIVDTISAPLPPVTVGTRPAQAAPTPEQQLTAAIAADNARTVIIYQGPGTSTPLATGTYLPVSRAVAIATSQGHPKDAVIGFPNGALIPASISHEGATVTIYGFADSAKLPAAPPATLPLAASLKQGQTVIAVTKDNAAVTGIISKVDDAGISTTLTGVLPGAALVDLNGNVIGIGSDVDGIFLPSDKIMTLLTAPVGTPGTPH